MVTLYKHGSGCSECEIGKPAAPPETWIKLKGTAIRLLRAQGHEAAADLFENENFELFEATNGFGDEFHALAKKAKVEAYADYMEKAQEHNHLYANVASVFSNLRFYIRFIIVELDADTGVSPVTTPASIAPIEVVKRALRDSEQLLATNGAVSAIDRVHTALHGYLKWICEQSGKLPVSKDPSITELLKAVEKHPKLLPKATHSNKTKNILRAFATALDAVNQVRNQGSMAHPNELVDEADALLVVNATRTMLRYLDDRLQH